MTCTNKGWQIWLWHFEMAAPTCKSYDFKKKTLVFALESFHLLTLKPSLLMILTYQFIYSLPHNF